MGVAGYKKDGRFFEGEIPFLLLCPQCGDVLECATKNMCYCSGCRMTWDKKEVKEMCKFIGNNVPVEYKEGEDGEDESNTVPDRTYL